MQRKARLALANGSLLAGSAFSNSMVGIVHAIGHSLGGVCGLPHGLAMAILLPHCMRFNLDKCADDYEDILSFLIAPEDFVATKKGDRAMRCVEEVSSFTSNVASRSGLSLRLGENNVSRQDFDEVAKRAINDGAMIVNPKAVGFRDVLDILNSAL